MPDYGDATPVDLARSLMTGSRRKARYRRPARRYINRFPTSAASQQNHLMASVKLPKVVFPRKLANIAVKMLRTNLMENALIGPLQSGPERPIPLV